MDYATVRSAVVAFSIALGTTLIALLADKQDFSEVSNVAYFVAFVGSLVSVLKDLNSSSRPPAE